MWNEMVVDFLIFAYSIVSVFLVEEWDKFTKTEKKKDKPDRLEFILSAIVLFLFWPILFIYAAISNLCDKKR